ncbi:hypothetical protein HC256_005304 [Beauveria bassiana]|nr:hypothetical protein HC256_005304 [Beauveria bassiana]
MAAATKQTLETLPPGVGEFASLATLLWKLVSSYWSVHQLMSRSAKDLPNDTSTPRQPVARQVTNLNYLSSIIRHTIAILCTRHFYVELVTAIHAAGLKWLFVALEFLDLALATVEGLSLPPGMVVVFDPPGLDSYTGAQLSLSGLVDGADEADVQNTNEGKDVEVRETVRICTRGSTGTVKVAVVPHKA